MKYISYENQQTTGINHIDAGHEILFSLISRILKVLNKNSIENVRFTEVLLADLQEEMIHHFRHEERLMEIYEIESMKEHSFEHKRFKEAFDDLILVIKNEENIEDKTQKIISIISSFNKWIHTHVMEYDKKIALKIQEKGER